MNQNERKTVMRRMVLLIAVAALVMGLYALRLIFLQLVNSDEYKSRATNTTDYNFTVTAARGDIVDSTGKRIATTTTSYNVVLNKLQMGDEDLDSLLQRVVELFEKNGESWTDTLLISQPDAAGTLSASLMLHLRAWRSYQLQYAADAFSTRFETELVPQELAAEELVCLLNATTTVSGSGPLPDAGAQLRACFVSYGPVSISQQSGQGGGWALTARATATAFAENSLGELDSYEKTLELSVPIPAEVPAGMQLQPECWLSTDSVQCTCTGGEPLTVTITARAEGAILGRSTRQGIGSISLGEALTPADPEITLRIYYAQEGEALFDIARRFHVPPAQMLAANGLDPDTRVLTQAQHFLVPGL